MSDEPYYDMEGNKVTLWQLVRMEPQWACSRITHLTKQLSDRDAYIKRLYLADEEELLLDLDIWDDCPFKLDEATTATPPQEDV